jgi:hypothetical protein
MRNPKMIVVAIVALVFIVAAHFFEISDTQYSCLECRATLTKQKIGGIHFQHVSQHVSLDSYSTSFLAHDPTHQHHWRWCGSTHSRSLTSESCARGRRHPIWMIPVSVQSEYSLLVPSSELHRSLQAIDSPDRKTADAAAKQVWECVLESQDSLGTDLQPTRSRYP